MFDGNVVIKKYVWAGAEAAQLQLQYSISLFGGEHKFFTNTHMALHTAELELQTKVREDFTNTAY